MHYDPKKYTKKYKMRIIQKKEDMISYHQLKKIEEKVGEAQKLGQTCQKIRKFEKI